MLRGKRQRALLGLAPKKSKNENQPAFDTRLLVSVPTGYLRAQRLVAELASNAELPLTVQMQAAEYLHALVWLGSEKSQGIFSSTDWIAAAVGGVCFACKSMENPPKRDLIDVAVRLLSAGAGRKRGNSYSGDLILSSRESHRSGSFLSVERFYGRRKALRDKAGFFEGLILRVVNGVVLDLGLNPPMMSPQAQGIFMDFLRCPSSLYFQPETVAEAAETILGILKGVASLEGKSDLVIQAVAEISRFYATAREKSGEPEVLLGRRPRAASGEGAESLSTAVLAPSPD